MSLAEEFGVKLPKAPPPDEKVKKPAINPFDFVNEINYGKNSLIVDEWSEKQYSPYIVNQALSFGVDTILYANEMNRRPHLDKKMQHDYLIHSIRKKKRFNKWEKKEKENKSISIIKRYYGYNNERAQEALIILTPEQIQELETRLSVGGVK